MNLAIMQPYFLPYIGYFQLIKAVDIFVIYDDVNYIKKGWINRNKILLNNKEHLFTMPLLKSSQNKIINEIDIFNEKESKKKLLQLFHYAYVKAPEYKNVYPLIEDIVLNNEDNLSKYIEYSLNKISKFLELDTLFIRSSEINKNSLMSGQDKIIDICKILHADTYINPIGGIELYKNHSFSSCGIKLSFLKSKLILYKQNNNEFIQGLSILDMMMFLPKKKIKLMLDEYQLI